MGGSTWARALVFVASYSRSGSTILGNVLGAHPGFVYGGELRDYWEQIARGGACGCGEPVTRCSLWSEVSKRLGGSVEPGRAMRLQREAIATKRIPSLVRAWGEPASAPPALAEYSREFGRLLGAIHDVAEARVIVDTSKRPANAALARLAHENAFVVHLVRDPRAIAHSWLRRREGLSTFRPRRVALTWLVQNAAIDLIRRKLPPARSLRLRYEDFTREPQAAVDRILRMIGAASEDGPFLDARTVRLPPNHTIAGNPGRFGSGEIVLREDDVWRGEQDPRQRALVTSLTLPGLLRYGYPLRVRAR